MSPRGQTLFYKCRKAFRGFRSSAGMRVGLRTERAAVRIGQGRHPTKEGFAVPDCERRQTHECVRQFDDASVERVRWNDVVHQLEPLGR